MTRVAAIDIGTNSMRLLVRDEDEVLVRRQKVTGLGRGVDRTGLLAAEAVARTLAVLAGYGLEMEALGVARRRAVATSASRDAANHEPFFLAAAEALGVMPEIVSGTEEADLSFRGATSSLEDPGAVLVNDIGGGSTEFVSTQGGVSFDIGSVRLTERRLPDRPATPEQVDAGFAEVAAVMDGFAPPPFDALVGVAGTWTSLGGLIVIDGAYEDDKVDGAVITRSQVEDLVQRLASLSLEETRALPALDPERAPVILGGAIVAASVMRLTGAATATVSVSDLLDGIALELLAG